MAILRITLLIIGILLNTSQTFCGGVITQKMKELSNTKGLEIEIKLDKEQYYLGDPILVQCLFKNTGNLTLSLREILLIDLLFGIKEQGASKARLLETRTFPNEVFKASNVIKIDTGKSYLYEREINKTLYSMPKQPGSYELYAVYWNRVDKSKNTKFWVGKIKSNSIKFEIIEKVKGDKWEG